MIFPVDQDNIRIKVIGIYREISTYRQIFNFTYTVKPTHQQFSNFFSANESLQAFFILFLGYDRLPNYLFSIP